MFRYSLRSLLVVVALTALALPWLISAVRKPVVVRVDLDGVRMPPEAMPDESQRTDHSRRHRLVFREWFEEREFVLDPALSTLDADYYRGEYRNSKPIVAKIRFSPDTRVYVTVSQQTECFPWEETNYETLDSSGAQFVSELNSWTKRYHHMEQVVRRIAGVEDRSWPFSESMTFSPGVRYSPQTPRSNPDPEWSRGFRRSGP